MSTLNANLEVAVRPVVAAGLELTGARTASVGAMTVRRLLPLRERRSVGAWCFVDHYGPMSVDGASGMAVPPHPHIGLQTVTWLFAGNVLHKDSLGSEQMIRPGQLNLMTAGRGIAHSEESPTDPDPELHGVQLWVALPDRSRHAPPAFEHHGELPSTRAGGMTVTVMLGSMAGLRSPATAFTGIVAAELAAVRDAAERIVLDPTFEHAVLVAIGSARAAETDLTVGSMLYLPPGHGELPVVAREGTVLMLLGGVPLGEPLLMWWNFVARTPGEIAAAVASWREGGFGEVGGYAGRPLEAPPLDVSRLRLRAQS